MLAPLEGAGAAGVRAPALSRSAKTWGPVAQSPRARTVAQVGTPSLAAVLYLHGQALSIGVLVPLPSSMPHCLAGREPLETLPAAACTD